MEPDKIEAIKQYLHTMGVEYYDVQAELIDHFASSIIDQQKENPNLSFKEALHIAHKKFGGKESFRVYVEKAEARVSKKTTKLLGNVMLGFFSWPYLVLTFALALSWFSTFYFLSFPIEFLVAPFLILYIAAFIYNWFTVKKSPFFLVKRGTRSLGLVFYFGVYQPSYFLMFRESSALTSDYLIFGSIYFTFISLLLIALTKAPKAALKETRKLYPKPY